MHGIILALHMCSCHHPDPTLSSFSFIFPPSSLSPAASDMSLAAKPSHVSSKFHPEDFSLMRIAAENLRILAERFIVHNFTFLHTIFFIEIFSKTTSKYSYLLYGALLLLWRYIPAPSSFPPLPLLLSPSLCLTPLIICTYWSSFVSYA